ncbi:MAG TPA: low molecular weight phosphatase family protein [Acidobacteriota bacterium]|nr:low molecular weight phosphatase family protein [Acidobacteriota bacterium]
MKSILFVCTGNIFRSVTAEYCLKAQLRPKTRLIIGSAGTEAKPQRLNPILIEFLRKKGADPSAHVQRKLSREMLEEADVAIAMGIDHQQFIFEQFGRDVPLFNQVCYQREEPLLDVHEAMPDWVSRMGAARAYVQSVVDHIWKATPPLLERLPYL